jgi:hypothetical protein
VETEVHETHEDDADASDKTCDVKRVHLWTQLIPRGFRFPTPLTALLQKCDETEECESKEEFTHYLSGKRKS